MVALPGDVARGDERVKRAFETVFKAMVTVLSREVRNTTQDPKTPLWPLRLFVLADGRG